MGMIYLLLALQILLLLVALYKTKFNIGIPTNVMLIFLCVGFWFYALGYKTWDNPIKLNTIAVIMTGYLITFLFSLFTKRVTIPIKEYSKEYYSRNLNNEKNVSCLFWISLIFLLLYALGIFVAGRKAGYAFGNAIAYIKSTGGEGVNTLSRQGFKVISATSYIAVFLLIYDFKNRIYSHKIRIKIILMIVFGFVVTILSGSRGDLLKIISAFICVYFLFFSFKEKNTKKIAKYMVVSFVGGCIIFYVSRTVVKTFGMESTGSLAFFDYLNFYFGSSFEVLNIKLQNLNNYHSNLFGYNLLSGIYSILSDIGITLNSGITGKEFVYLGHYNFGGNVATYYFPILADFGYIGLIIIVSFKCFLGNYVYAKLMRRKSKFAIIYCSQLYSMYTFGFYSQLLVYYTNLSAIFSFVVLIILYNFTFRIKIK